MTIETYHFVACDGCGGLSDHYPFKPKKDQLIKDGIIVFRGKHYCCSRCKEAMENHERN